MDRVSAIKLIGYVYFSCGGKQPSNTLAIVEYLKIPKYIFPVSESLIFNKSMSALKLTKEGLE
jgi:hypothetical protein